MHCTACLVGSFFGSISLFVASRENVLGIIGTVVGGDGLGKKAFGNRERTRHLEGGRLQLPGIFKKETESTKVGTF